MKVIFLDRDGVINKEKKYLYKIEDFEFIDGVFNSCKYLLMKGFQLIIITNQSGIGRGYYKKKDFRHLTDWMKHKFDAQNIPILDILYCPHIAEDNCTCRKPKTGMFDEANNRYNIDKNDSWMIGDKETDIKAAIDFGIKNTILVESGHKIDKDNSNALFVLPSIKYISNVII